MPSDSPLTPDIPRPESSAPEVPALPVRALLGAMVALVLVTIALRSFVVESCPVQGPSMEPTLNEGERVLVWKLPMVFGFGSLHSGDLVVFNRPEEGGRRYVKRVIAAGPAGETDAPTSVVFEKGRVFVNNQLLDEPYLTPEERDSPLEFQATLTEGQYFVLGDHRSVSKDSLRFGPIAENQVIGKAFLRIWPLGKAGLL